MNKSADLAVNNHIDEKIALQFMKIDDKPHTVLGAKADSEDSFVFDDVIEEN
jgi:hypothetical protein